MFSFFSLLAISSLFCLSLSLLIFGCGFFFLVGMRLIPFVSEESSLPFMYVECLSGAPLLVRSKMLEEMPGFRLDIPQSMSDYALALDAWSAGWQVGVFGASTVDTRPFGLNDVHKTVRRLEKLLRYDRKSILNRIRDLNIRTLTQRFKE